MFDLESRKNKLPGGYARIWAVTRRTFIHLNTTGSHQDVMDLIHEAGHAFAALESAHLSLLQVTSGGHGGGEWTEFMSQTVELLALPYLAASEGGFYTEVEAASAQIKHLEGVLSFFPYLATVDAFQHWVYTHPEQAVDPAQCDRQWGALDARFLPGIDWDGLEAERETGWQHMGLLFVMPLFFVEYGISLLGALQVWRNARHDQAGAVAAYRRALALGGGAGIPERYAAAGAKFALDADTLAEMIALVEQRIEQLEAN